MVADRRLIAAPHLLDVVGGTWLDDRRILVDGERIEAVLGPGDPTPADAEPRHPRRRLGRPGAHRLPQPPGRRARVRRHPGDRRVGGRGGDDRRPERAHDAPGRVHDGPRRRDVPGVHRRRPARRHRSRLDARAADAVRRRLHHRAGRWRRGHGRRAATRPVAGTPAGCRRVTRRGPREGPRSWSTAARRSSSAS